MISLLERERRNQGLTAAGLASRMGTSPATVSQIERGRLVPSTEMRKRAAAALRVRVDELFPEFFVLTVTGVNGLLLAGVQGQVFAFTRKAPADRAARRTESDVHGPVPISTLALLLGVTEIEVAESLVVDPAEELIEAGDTS